MTTFLGLGLWRSGQGLRYRSPAPAAPVNGQTGKAELFLGVGQWNGILRTRRLRHSPSEPGPILTGSSATFDLRE